MKAGFLSVQIHDQARLRALIAGQQKAWWLPVLLGALAAVPELSEPRTIWVLVLATCLPISGVFGVLVYRWNRDSLRALFFMLDSLVFSIFPLLMLMVWNIYRRLDTYWLFSDYCYLYIAILILALGYGIYYGVRRWAPRLKALGRTIRDGSIDAGSVYRCLFASSEVEKWARGKGIVLIGVASVGSIVVSGIGGRAYLFAALSLWAIVFLPPIMVSAIVRGWYLRRLLGSSDVEIRFAME